ncbi:MAG: hypothetical protein FWD49_03330 [Firmicutes bacterium]|nr:hypothetical protein [Bacillota bacterium]
MKKTKKLLIFAIVALVLAGATSLSFAFWSHGFSAPSNTVKDESKVTLGTGESVTTTISLSGGGLSGGALVPSTLTKIKDGETQEIVWTMNVVWNSEHQNAKDYNGAVGLLNVSAEVVAIGNTEAENFNQNQKDASALIKFGVQANGEENLNLNNNFIIEFNEDGGNLEVIVKITMDEPSSEAIYNAIHSQEVTIALTLSITLA